MIKNYFFLKNLINLKLLNNPRPVSGVFWITENCNCRCKMCNIWNKPSRQEMDLETFSRIFKESKLLRRLNLVVFTGGEPFLKDDLPAFIEIVNRYSSPLNISFGTNGLFTAKIISILEKILAKKGSPLNVKLSLDGISEEHDKIRGVSGSFNNSLNTLSKLCQLKLKYPKRLTISLGFTVTSFNYHQMPSIMELAKRNEVEFFYKPVMYATMLQNEDIDKSLFISEEHQQFLVKHHDEIIANIKNSKFGKRYLYLKYLNFLNKYYRKPARYFPCYALRASFHISADWDVFSCLKLSYKLGNLRDASFDKIFNGEEACAIREKIQRSNCHCLCTGEIFPSIIAHKFPLFL